MNKQNLLFLFILAFSLFSCSSKKSEKKSDTESVTTQERNHTYQHYNAESEEAEIENTESSNNSECKIEDGTYSATVDYNNPETGYSATYTLDVEVQDCQVVQINFPNDGYLDEDHISAADLDEDGNANVDGEDGKTYVVLIDN